MVMSIIDCVEEFSRLWEESSNLAIIPSRNNALSISHKFDTVTFKAWNFNSKELLSSLSIPNTDIVDGCCGEEVRVTGWEGNIIDTFAMTCVSEFWCNASGVTPVNSGLRGSCEEV